ncbi:MAG: EF-P lysine aminoacylase EpmA [Kistimonas sp.]|nr:EF-P lysine aminoacylase EpmA [Kistimonas sp.]
MTDWKPSASLAALRQRGALLQHIRAWFHEHDVLEVTTPLLSHHAPVDPHIDSFHTRFQPSAQAAESQVLYLHTSPEFAMKRLLAAGSGDIYFLGPVFRNGEAGQRHNPEFTMLEWYRKGIDHHQLMSEVTALLSAICCFRETGRVTYQSLFEQTLDIDPHNVSHTDLLMLVQDKIDKGLDALSRNDCLDLLFSHCIEPHLGSKGDQGLEGVYVYDYPASMAALARLTPCRTGPRRAARFELFVGGVELANGYHELTDAEEQRTRFASDQSLRQQLGKPVPPCDLNLLHALKHGLPDCAGVAMGVERLHMLMAGTNTIGDVLPFDFSRA